MKKKIFLSFFIIVISFFCLEIINAEELKCVYRKNLDASTIITVTYKINFNFGLNYKLSSDIKISDDKEYNDDVTPFALSNTITTNNFILGSESDDVSTTYKCPSQLYIGCIPDNENIGIRSWQGGICGIVEYIETKDVLSGELNKALKLTPLVKGESSEKFTILKPTDEEGNVIGNTNMTCNYSTASLPAGGLILKYNSNYEIPVSIDWRGNSGNNKKFIYKDTPLIFGIEDRQKAISHFEEEGNCPLISLDCDDAFKQCNVYYGNKGKYKYNSGNSDAYVEELEENLKEKPKRRLFDDWSDIKASLGGSIFFDSSNTKLDCGVLNGTDGKEGIIDILDRIFGYAKIAIIVLFVLLSALDFMKAVSNDAELNKAFTRLWKRAIIMFAFYLLPSIINLILKIILIENGTCSIG